MNKREAVEFLTKALPFGNKGGGYTSEFDGEAIKDMDELLRVLHEYGGITLRGRHPDYGNICINVSLEAEVTYKVVSPSEGDLKAIEAVHALVPHN